MTILINKRLVVEALRRFPDLFDEVIPLDLFDEVIPLHEDGTRKFRDADEAIAAIEAHPGDWFSDVTLQTPADDDLRVAAREAEIEARGEMTVPAVATPRDLVDVIDAVVAVAPDLAPALEPVRQSALFTAPEQMWRRWHAAQTVLLANASEHPKRSEIEPIFTGRKA